MRLALAYRLDRLQAMAMNEASIPILLVLSVAGAFAAGRYVGTYDANEKFAILAACHARRSSQRVQGCEVVLCRCNPLRGHGP
jgi:hypothetical protein